MASPITTINERPPRDQFTANGTQTTFSVDWPARRTADVVVEFNSGETPSIGYTFSPSALNDDAGFDVIFNSPPPAGTLVTVYRQGALERLTNYGQQKAFTAATVNAEFADLMLRMQEMKRDLQRTVRLPASDPAAQLFLPARATRAGKYATYDENGNLSVSGEAPDGDGADSVIELHGLNDDGITDQSAEFEAAVAEAVANSVHEWRLTGKGDGTSAIRFSRRAIIPAMPPSVVVSRARFIFDADTQAGIYIRGQEVELPESGKAKLWTDVDVSGGAVTTFDISVSPNPGIVDLLVAGAIVIIRGQNGADGDVLDGHRHEDIVVSCVQVSSTRYTLTLTNGLPDTIDGSVWKTEWPDSEHATDPDETLISVLAMAYATADMTDSRTMTIAAGKAAALGLAAGSWVEVIDDATGSDTHGTSTELLNRQTVRIAAVEAGTPDTITFDEPVRGTFTTANRARLVLLTTCPEFKFQGPGPAFPIRVVGTPPASPASRRHLIEVKYCISPEIAGWFYEYVAADGSTRGAPIRDSHCYEPWVHHNGVANPWPSFAGAHNGGDYYCAWSKGSTRPLYEHNTFLGGRHSLVIANAVGGTVRFNELGYSGFQCLDFHGENEIDVEAYGNTIVAGPDWDDRSRKVAIQVGNQTHTSGTKGALIRDNDIIGFDAAEDIGSLIVSGCSDIIVDQHFIHPVGEAVRIDADNRAPDVMIERITIAGSTPGATIGVVADGRMQVWESEGEVSGSASRPVYLDDSTGTRRYVTEDEGTLGTVNPTHTTGTETSGDIDLEYVGLVSAQTLPIDGVKVWADTSGAGTGLVQYRADNVVVAPASPGSPLVLKSASAWDADDSTILLNGQMGIELDTGLGKYGNGIDVWGDLGDYAFSVAIDLDGNTHTVQLRRDTATNWGSSDPTLAAGEAGYDETNNAIRIGDGSTAWSGLTPIAGSGSATAAFVLTSAITSATTLTTADAWYTSSAGTLTIRRVQIELGSPGRIDFAEDLPANTIFELYITEASAQVTLGIENDGGSIAEGESAGATLLPESGSIVSAVVVSNAGTAPIMHTLGNFSGAENVISGDLVVKGDLVAKTEVQIECFDSATEVTTGDGAAYFVVPASMDGWNLVSVEASNLTAAATGSGSETTDIQVHNLTQAADMLSTKLTIDEDEFNSSTAAAAAVIDTSNDDVATGDRLRIDLDDVPSTTGGTGLVATLGFQKP